VRTFEYGKLKQFFAHETFQEIVCHLLFDRDLLRIAYLDRTFQQVPFISYRRRTKDPTQMSNICVALQSDHWSNDQKALRLSTN
jgi:hypothetical protein